MIERKNREDWTKLQKEEVHDWYTLVNIITKCVSQALRLRSKLEDNKNFNLKK
jgi:hypothetical protein